MAARTPEQRTPARSTPTHRTTPPSPPVFGPPGRARPSRRTAAALVLAVLALPGVARTQDALDTGPTDGLFSLPRSQDDIAEWQQAREEIAERSYEAAVERLHRLLRSGSRGVVPELGASDRWIGLRRSVIETLRDLPPAAQESYERLCRREAGRTWETPMTALSAEQLQFLADGFPSSSRGVLARLRLGDLALVAGDGVAAQFHFRAALDAVGAADARRDAIGARLRVAELLARAAVAPTEARGPVTEEAIRAVPTFGDVGWAGYGGGYDGARVMDTPVGDAAEPYRVPLRADGFEFNDFAMHAVGDLRAIFVNDGHAVRAIDPIGRSELWVAPGPMIDSDDVDEAREAINTDMILSSALSDDLVVAALQVPNEVIGADRNQRFRDVISIVQKIPSRRLFAFDRSTGKRVWAHWDFTGGPVSDRFQGHEVCSAPVIHGDTIYVPTHDPTGAIAFYASAYDLHTGEPRWRRLVCSSQQEVNMFGNARQEFAAGPIAVHDGVVLGTTNLGLCYAVDAQDGDLRWLSAYPVIPLPRTRLRDQERRPVFFANNPIAVADGVMATTPLDSEFALGLDVETGRIVWQLPYDPRPDTLVRWLFGALGDEFVFGGLGLIAVQARPSPGEPAGMRIVASPESLGEDHYRSTAIPRGALTEDRIWFVGSDGGVRILDRRGNRDPRMARMALGGRGTGNLLLTDGIVAALSGSQLQCFADVDALIRDARRRAAEPGASPAAVLRLAMLLRARGLDDPQVLEDLFVRGLEAAVARGLGPGTAVHRQLADGLFGLTMDRAADAGDPATSRRLLELARERATSARQWLRAQQALLVRCETVDGLYRRELARLAERFPDEMMLFPAVGRVPAGVYAAWRAIDAIEDPRAAAIACQRLMERHGDVAFGGRTVRAAAEERLAALVARHGDDVLASIEAEAAGALRDAGDDSAALQRIAQRYPLTRASRLATARLLDVALARGDFGAFTRAWAQVTDGIDASPGAVRRLIAAAEAGGNLPLAHALAARLVEVAGATPSDLPADGGRTLAEALTDLPPLPVAEPPRPEPPVRVVARLTPPNAQSSYDYWPARAAPGFPAPAALPLFVEPSDGELVVHALTEPFDPSAPLATTSIRGAIDGPILVCGDVAVAVDAQRAFGLDLATGEERWSIPAAHPGALTPIGIEAGVLLLVALDPVGLATSGRLLGVEPLTGATLYEQPLGGDRVPATPVRSAGRVWTMDASDVARPLLRAHDPLTGRVAESTPVPTAALTFLGIDGPQARRLADPTIRGAVFADATRVYLPVDLAGPEEPSRMVAIARGSGAIAWTFAGLSGCTIQRAGVRGDRVVVFERGSAQARLVILRAADGTVEAAFDFGAMAAVRNWDRFPHPEPAPAIVLVTDLRGAVRFTTIAIEPDGPRFEPQLGNVGRFLRDPLVGDGYVLVPYSRPNGASPVVEVLDLATREGALPNGERTLRLDGVQLATFHAHGRHLVVKTLDMILVMAGPR